MRVLYLSYNGLLEPLGQSQVFAYLRLLSRQHRITLITFEKPADFADAGAMQAQREVCDRLGIRWLPQRYHHKPRLLATAWDLTVYVSTSLFEAARGRADVIHCRNYVSSSVGLIIHWLLRKPFIFDMRALWPEEMLAAGRLKPNSPLFHAIKFMEKLCLTRAAAVVSLTEAAVEHLRTVYGSDVAGTRFCVIPTCVDLDRFTPSGTANPGVLTLGSLGSVLSGWFKFDWLVAFFEAARAIEPDARLTIVTREDRDRVVSQAVDGGVEVERLSVFGVHPSQVPQAIAALSAVPMFYETGLASLGRSPTRLGEVLACGTPAVVNAGVGDVDAILRDYRVGVVMNDASPENMRAGAAALIELLADPALPARCRKAAEECFSLDGGAARYDALYHACTVARAPRRMAAASPSDG